VLCGLLMDNVCVCVCSGEIECVSSDHCAFNMAQKAVGKDDFRFIPAGVNGVTERLVVVWDRAVVSDALSTHLNYSRTSIHYILQCISRSSGPYRVFQKKLHKVCHVINFEPFVLGLQCFVCTKMCNRLL